MVADSVFAWPVRLVATAALVLVGASSCVSTTGGANAPSRVEVRQLAPGVELRVNEEAGPAAVQAADQIERDFRSRYSPAMRYTYTSEHYRAPIENVSMR